MKRYLYLSLTPEALIASMLSPEEFGNYLAVGTKKRTRGQAIYFEVDIEEVKDLLPLDLIERKCIPTKDGTPKRTVYLSIYRVLEKIPLKALKKLYLATDDGRVLSLEKGTYDNNSDKEKLHLYQEICPVTPRIASTLSPKKFAKRVTDNKQNVSVPKIVFVELQIGELASAPRNGKSENLPYSNIPHLRDCLINLQEDDKYTKTVIRFFQGDFLYRTCKNGFFVGAADEFIYYPFPTKEELEDKYFPWWRSALNTGFR